MQPDTSFVLRSKLAPALAPALLKRERMRALLAPLRERRLALIAAGAGAGKTTFAAQALDDMAMDAAWYALDERDQDERVFLRGLVWAVRERVPGFGEDVLARLEQARAVSGQGGMSRPGGLLDLFLRGLETGLADHLALVLDDFHLLRQAGAESGALDAVEYIAPRLPGKAHLIVISRTLPPLRLSRLRAERQTLEIGPAEIAFTREESAALCRMLSSAPLEPEELERIHARTEGWAAPLVLAAGNPSFALPDIDAPVGRYIEENVFQVQPAKVQEFMLLTSVAPWLEPELCDAICGGESREIIERLGGCLLVLTSREDGGERRYHHLLRDFLLERAENTLGRERLAAARRRAGDFFAARGDVQNGLLQYLEARDFEKLCELLSRLDVSDLARCSLGLALQATNAVPPRVLGNYPAVRRLKARMAYLRGDINGAAKGLRQALAGFEKAGDEAGKIRCLKDLGFYHYLVGDVQSAYETLSALWPALGQDVWSQGETGGMLIFFAALLGRLDQAEAWRDRGLARIPQTTEPAAFLARHWISYCDSIRLQSAGDFIASDLLLGRAVEAFTSAGAEIILPIVYMQYAMNDIMLRRPEDGLAHAEQGLLAARRLGLADHQLAWLFCVKAWCSLMNGDRPTAVLCVREALEIFTALGNPWGRSAVRDIQAQIMLSQGRAAEAVEELGAALDLVKDMGLRTWEDQLALEQVEALMACGRLDEAEQGLDALGAEASPSAFNRFRALLLRGLAAAGLSRPDQAGEYLARALSQAEERGYQCWIALYADKIRELLNSFPPGKGKDRLRALVSRLPRTRPAVQVMDQPPPLHVSCLGGFKVSVGERAVQHQAWRNLKARRIFQYLALAPHHGFTPRDVLLELAWPEQDPELTAPRFHVALHGLRRLLEPELKRGQRSSYISRRGEAYRLELGPGGEVDVSLFLEAVERAKRRDPLNPDQALRRYLEAEALCAGELLPSQVHEEWLDDLRLRVRFAYLATLSRIMRFLEERGEWAACVEYAEKHLALEEHSEPAHRAVMRCRAAMGDKAGAVEAFRRCEKAIAHDLGCPLSAETQALKASILSREKTA